MINRAVTRQQMNHISNSLSNALLLLGVRQIDTHLTQEKSGLHLRMNGEFSPSYQQDIERIAGLLQPKVKDPALVETYRELVGIDQYTSEGELALIGQMLDAATVEVSGSWVYMEIYLAF